MKKVYGRLIGASLGPGDPGLMTRRVFETLSSDARWAYPVRRAGEPSYALEIARRAGFELPADAMALEFPMTREALPLARAWSAAAASVIETLSQGRDVVFLVEGDASTYATFSHLARTAGELAPEVVAETIPGVSSFSASAARLGVPLASEDDTLAVIPAAYGVEVIEHLLDEFDTLVLLKVKPLLDEILELLARRGLLNEACLIEKVGSVEERIVADISALRGQKVAYLSLMLVKNPNRARGPLQRGCRKKAGQAA